MYSYDYYQRGPDSGNKRKSMKSSFVSIATILVTVTSEEVCQCSRGAEYVLCVNMFYKWCCCCCYLTYSRGYGRWEILSPASSQEMLANSFLKQTCGSTWCSTCIMKVAHLVTALLLGLRAGLWIISMYPQSYFALVLQQLNTYDCTSFEAFWKAARWSWGSFHTALN